MLRLHLFKEIEEKLLFILHHIIIIEQNLLPHVVKSFISDWWLTWLGIKSSGMKLFGLRSPCGKSISDMQVTKVMQSDVE